MDKYQFTRDLRLIQEAAEADPGLSEIVVAYGRLCTDRGVEPTFCESLEEARAQLLDAKWFQQPFLARNRDLDPRVSLLCVNYGKELARRRVPVLLAPEDMAFQLGISMRQLNWLAYAREGRYHTFERAKANGKVRVIHAPTPKLKTVQRWIAERIVLKTKPHKYSTAFFPGSTLVDNASPHVGRAIVVRMDLKDFFPSIKFNQVRRVFSSFGYTLQVSRLLANICCYEGHLVQGAPSSPAISNLVAKRLDTRVEGIKKFLSRKEPEESRLKFYYTRYADDLVFSSDQESLLSILPFVRQVVTSEGFAVNEDKLRIMRAARQQKVTGLVVNERLNAPSKQFELIRNVIHGIRHQGVGVAMQRWSEVHGQEIIDAAHFRQILSGKIAFIASVNPEKSAKLLDGLDALDFNT